MKLHDAIALLILLAFAAVLRTDFGEFFNKSDSYSFARPVHADEATQAYISANLLENGELRYDPKHHHGPLPHYIHNAIVRPLGVKNLAQLQIWQLRIQPLIAGLLSIFLVYQITRQAAAEKKSPAPFIALLLAASSPLLAYYNHTAIPESTFALLALALPFFASKFLTTLDKPPPKKNTGKLPPKKPCVAFARLRSHNKRAAQNATALQLLAVALIAAFLHATKETCTLLALSWIAALLILCPKKILPVLRAIGLRKILATATLAILVSAFLYTQFFTHPQGFLDSYRSYFIYETNPAHAKPWFYYLQNILTLRQTAGVFYGELAITALALLYLVQKLPNKLRRQNVAANVSSQAKTPAKQNAETSPANAHRQAAAKNFSIQPSTLSLSLPTFLAVSALIQILIYSILPYKTPWLMITPVLYLVPAAGQAAADILVRCLRPLKIPALILFLAVTTLILFANTKQLIHATLTTPDKPDIPLIYVPTTREADRQLRALSDKLPPQTLIAVIGDDYWPLPWYLRQHRANIGYFETTADYRRFLTQNEIPDFPVIIHSGQIPARVRANYQRNTFHLRPDFPITIETHNSP